MKFRLSLILLFSFSCSSLKKTPERQNEVQIRISHLKNLDSWKVVYLFPEPVYSLAFQRPANFRSKQWTLADKDLYIKNINGIEYVFSKSKKMFNRLSLTHKSYYEDFKKDYNFFLKYTDNDVLMYTGFYDVYPITVPVDSEKGLLIKPEVQNITNFYFNSFEEDNIIALGEIINERSLSAWQDIAGKGTYIYWGASYPFESKAVTVVVDKSVPKWITRDVEHYLPLLFSYYTKKTGVQLKSRPVVFINWTHETLKGLGNLGSTLPGVIQLTLRRRGFKNKTQDNTEYLFEFLAHESAHLWNGQMFKRAKKFEMWINEGGADAFAYRAMKDLKIITNKRYKKLLETAKKRCLKGLLNKMTLFESGQHKEYDNYYFCGSTIALSTEKKLKEGDLFLFWKKLFQRAKLNNYTYGINEYFKLTKDLIGESYLKELKTFIYGPYKEGSKKQLKKLLE